MPLYMFSAKLSSESAKKLVANPEDRGIQIAHLCESFGGSLHAYYFAFGEADVIAIADLPDNETAMSMSMAVGSSGAVSDVKTTVLVPSDQAVDVLKNAARVAGQYTPPGG